MRSEKDGQWTEMHKARQLERYIKLEVDVIGVYFHS